MRRLLRTLSGLFFLLGTGVWVVIMGVGLRAVFGKPWIAAMSPDSLIGGGATLGICFYIFGAVFMSMAKEV